MLYIRYSLILLLVFIFLSCNTNDKKQANNDTTITRSSVDTSQQLIDTDLLRLINDHKNLPPSLIKKYLSFDAAYVDSMINISGFSTQKYSDSILIAFINFNDGGNCGERYIVTIRTPEIKQVAKLLVTTYCDSDQMEDSHKLDYIYKNDSTFETADRYYGQGKLMENGRKADHIRKSDWHIQNNGNIVLIREYAEDEP